jgi:hypothetical protein
MLNENTGYVVGDGGLILKKDSIIKTVQVKQLLPVKLFPNPVNDKATLDFQLDKALKISIQVTDERGNIVLTQNAKSFDKGAHQINLLVPGLHRGVYQVNLLANGTILGNARLIIVR